MRTDGHMTKLIVAFRNFANAPKIGERAIDCVCVCVITCVSRMSVAVVSEWTVPCAPLKGSGNVALSKGIGQVEFRNL
jgi:hypothetical protein